MYERTVTLLNNAAIDDGNSRRIPRQLTQQEIANQVGASREMVNHVLRDLIRGGFIVREPTRGMKIAMKLPEHW
ncbi:helix-turn-helix domain-containing protein [Thermomonas sp. HDW16]|uniref:helix-turn-helix domain-containing protein n=1 Tax=Thermomonas sp. HDW16 TaxID=2714945 RepID=UPI0021033EEE|nr:helix-turn-helix domain-containing protein [Thermomonas sp. HDW16]